MGRLHVKLKDLIKQKVIIAGYGKATVSAIVLFIKTSPILGKLKYSIIILKSQKSAPNLKIITLAIAKSFFYLCTIKQMHCRLLEYNIERVYSSLADCHTSFLEEELGNIVMVQIAAAKWSRHILTTSHGHIHCRGY